MYHRYSTLELSFYQEIFIPRKQEIWTFLKKFLDKFSSIYGSFLLAFDSYEMKYDPKRHRLSRFMSIHVPRR